MKHPSLNNRDRISQKIEMLFSDYEIGVIMGQKAKNAGKTKAHQGHKAKTARELINKYNKNPKLVEECETTVARLLELGFDINKLCEIIKLYQKAYLEFVEIVGEDKAQYLTFERFYKEKLIIRTID
jgi:hypothetical protein